MFTKLYLDTTNPKNPFYKFLEPEILLPMIGSVLFHTILYTVFFNLVSYVFTGKVLSIIVNQRILVILLIIMFFGFIGRYLHVRDVYNAYNGDIVKTRNHLDKLYISWIFIS